MARPVRIANFSGAMGDRSTALAEVVLGEPVDVVIGDFMAEITMSMVSSGLQQAGRDVPRGTPRRTFGADGPWAARVGFDQVAGTVTGMVAAEGTLAEPRLPPTMIINDYLVAWLGATCPMAALARRALEGGSCRVHVSLTRAAMWAATLGVFDREYARAVAGSGGEHELLDPQLFTSLTPLGIYQGVTENVTLSRTPHHYLSVLSPRGPTSQRGSPAPSPRTAGPSRRSSARSRTAESVSRCGPRSRPSPTARRSRRA